MENVLDILTKYKEKGIRIGLDSTGENLSIKGELSGLSDLDKHELRSSKELLLSFLQGQKQESLARTALTFGQHVALSPSQKGIWIHSRIEENDTMYLIPSVYDLVVPGLHQEALLSAAKLFVAAHPILASVFGEKEGEPYQQLTEFDPTKYLFFEDLSQLSADEKESQCAEKIRQSMQKGFDLTTKAPWSITVFDLGQDKYRFFVKIHHLIADGATLGLLVGGLVEAYELQQKGEVYHYRGAHHHDYVAWITDKTHQQRSSNFWKTYLEHYPDDLEFSTRVLVRETSSATSVEQSLPMVLREKTAQFSIAHNIPLSQLFTFCFGIVLSKYGRQNDVIIGTPVEGRTHPDLQKMLGDLVNTVPVRLALNYEVSVLENLQVFGKGYLSVLDHQQYPFEYILDDIGYQRQADRFPLFNTMVSFPNNQELGRKNENELKLAKEKALYDLTLSVIELADSTELQLEFDQKKFTAEYASGILEHTLTVLQQVVNSAQTALSEISLLTEIERKVYFEKGLPKSETKPTHLTVVEAITAIISKSPESIAVVEEETTYSYAALQLKSQAVAFTLAQQGMQPEDRVVVELPSGMDLLAAMLGIWQMGGVYVPIGTELPTTRKEEILQDSGAEIIIDAAFIAMLSQTTDQYAKQSTDDLAYLLYTSGSTGKPKGVAVSHGALLNKMMEEAALVKTTNLTTLTLTSPTFDVSFLELILPLTLGGTVVVAKDKLNEAVVESILQNKVNVLQGTPTYFSHFESELDEAIAQALNETLQLLCIGGESLNDALVKRLKKKLPSVRINNHYGPTEITIDALVKEDVSEFKQNSLGIPFENTGAIIVDDYNNVLPENVPGELVITGPSLANGYWNNDLETSSKFSSIEKLGLRVYKTGDLAAWSKEGEIHFIGRKDKQVKYRGYRIELEEINARLREVAGIRDAYTLVISNVLVSWIATDGVDETLIREHLQQTLPEYMIPTVYEQLSVLPMNANGKVAEKQLPQPRLLKAEYVAPRNELEEQLVQIWQEVLGVERVGIYDNFFELGGHSLKVMQLGNQYKQQLHVELPLKQLFVHPILEDHSSIIRNSESQISEIFIPRVEEQEDYPVSYAQQRMWLLSQMEGGSRAYHMPTLIRITGELNTDLFTQAIDRVIVRHEILRTVFIRKENGELRQKISSPQQIGFTTAIYDIRDIKEQENYIHQFVQGETIHSFDLSAGPLVRATLLRVGDNDYYFYYNLHHIISDGWSMQVLASEVFSTYQLLINGSYVANTLKLQHKDYTLWHRNKIVGQEGKKSKEFWLSKLSGELPVMNLPTQHLRPTIKEYTGGNIKFSFSEDLSKRLKEYCQKSGGTLFMGLIAGLKGVLYRYTNQDDIIIGTPVSGRTESSLEDQIGLFTNTLALRTKFSGQDSFSELFRKVKHEVLEAYDHQDYPFDQVVDDLNLIRDISRNPLFDLMLVVQNQEQNQRNHQYLQTDDQLKVNYEETEVKTSLFDLSIIVNETKGELVGLVQFDNQIYSEKFISQFIRHFVSFIDKGLSQIEKTISEIQYLSADEINTLLYQFNLTHEPFEQKKTIADLFEEQVLKTPDAIAVYFKNTEYTYYEINKKANLLANCLQKQLSIQPDDLIGICLERGVDIVIVILAVLKSGAAYVPVDKNFPEKRIKFISDDCKFVFLIDEHVYADLVVQSATCTIENPRRVNKSNDLAYIIYTSGTTGNPKGVMVEHRNVTNLIYSQSSSFEISETDRVLLFSNYTFDASVEQLFLALLNGACLYIADEETILSSSELETFIAVNKITHIHAVPTFLQRLNISQKYSLKRIISGGEPCPDSLAECMGKFTKFYNEYGPTETTVTSIMELYKKGHKLTIGKPISNTQIYILDSHGSPVPLGVNGLIYIAGNGVTRGYINRPQLTEERFLLNPFDGKTKMYLTGDMGCWTAEGNIVFSGRDDKQIKIRGYRIEPEEIESIALRFSEDISFAIVDAVEIEGEFHLVLFYQTSNEIEVSTLRSYLKDSLPSYMIPNHFFRIKEVPITHNGKVDMKALKNNMLDLGISTSGYVPPNSILEKKIVAIWQEELNRNLIGLNDNFFELGGNSLKIMNIINKISRNLGLRLKVSDVYKYSTPKLLSSYLDQENLIEKEEIIPVAQVKSFFDITPEQFGIWFECQKGARIASSFNLLKLYQSDERLNPNLIRESLIHVLERNEVLRTNIIFNQYGVVQKINPLDEIDISEIFDENFSAECISQNKMMDLIRSQKEHHFDLEKKPLLKIIHHFNNKGGSQLLLNIHHIIADGVSVELFIREFILTYVSLERNEEKTSPPSRIQFKDYSEWLNAKIENTKSKNAEYWMKQLIPLPETLPFKRQQKELISDEASVFQIRHDDQLVKQIKKYIGKNRISEYIFYSTVVAKQLSEWTELNDLILLSPLSLRPTTEIQNQIGLFLNTVPLRISKIKESTFEELVHQVKNTVLTNFDHQYYPYAHMMDELRKRRVDLKSGGFNIMLNVQNLTENSFDQPSEFMGVKLITECEGTTKFDLNISVTNSNELKIDIEYKHRLFTTSEMERFCNSLISNIKNVCNE